VRSKKRPHIAKGKPKRKEREKRKRGYLGEVKETGPIKGWGDAETQETEL